MNRIYHYCLNEGGFVEMQFNEFTHKELDLLEEFFSITIKAERGRVAKERKKQLRGNSSRSSHKQTLIEFLICHGPAERRLILAQTNIPEGSLSSLLAEPEFKRVDKGLWSMATDILGNQVS